MKDKPISLQRAVSCSEPVWKNSPGVKSQQFYEKYDFHYEDIWSLDYSAAYFLLVRLCELRDCHSGFPSNLAYHYEQIYEDKDEAHKRAHEMYVTILNKMIRGFYLAVTENFPTKKQEKIINKAWKLFYEWHHTLWD